MNGLFCWFKEGRAFHPQQRGSMTGKPVTKAHDQQVTTQTW